MRSKKIRGANTAHGNTVDTSGLDIDYIGRTGRIVKGRAEGSIQGELVETICIRDESSQHTEEYCSILSALGKPSSRNKETHNII